MNPVLLYMRFEPRCWWLAVGAAAPAKATETVEGAPA